MKFLRVANVLLADTTLTLRAKLAIALIANNKFLSQQKMANLLGVTRKSFNKYKKNLSALDKAADYSRGYLEVLKKMLGCPINLELKVLICVLEEYYKHYEDIFPGESRLANRLGINVRTVRRLKVQAKKMGVVAWRIGIAPTTNSKNLLL